MLRYKLPNINTSGNISHIKQTRGPTFVNKLFGE